MDQFNKLQELQAEADKFEDNVKEVIRISGQKAYTPEDAAAIKAYRESPVGANKAAQEKAVNSIKYDSDGDIASVGNNQVFQVDPNVMYTLPYSIVKEEIEDKEQQVYLVVTDLAFARSLNLGQILENTPIPVTKMVKDRNSFRVIANSKVVANRVLNGMQFSDLELGKKFVQAVNRPPK
jgi:hypothetical protein